MTRDQLKEKSKVQTIFLVYIVLLITTCALLTSCSVPRERPSKDKIYLQDLLVEVDGKAFRGVSVIERKDEHIIKVFPGGQVDRAVFTTCNRKVPIDKDGLKDARQGFFKTHYKFKWKVLSGIEDEVACALRIGVYERKHKRIGWATLLFEDSREEVSLPVTILCNGQRLRFTKGVSACQSAAGLAQVIDFAVPVKVVPPPGCDALTELSKNRFLLKMPLHECTYYFVSNKKASNGKRIAARVETFGWTDIPPPE